MDTNDLYIIDNFFIKKSLTVENFLCYSLYNPRHALFIVTLQRANICVRHIS